MDQSLEWKRDESAFYPLHKEPLLITKAQGNIVLEVDGKKASQVLIQQIASESSKNKDHQLFVRLTNQNHLNGFFSVTSGDVSKGALAIDTLTTIQPGWSLTFHRRGTPLGGDSAKCEAALTLSVVEPIHFAFQVETIQDCMELTSELGIIQSDSSVLNGYQVLYPSGLRLYQKRETGTE